MFIKEYYSIWTQDYWRDELFTIFLSRKDWLEILVLTADDFSPPLFYFFTKVWMLFAGEEPFYLRTLPMVGYVLCVVAAYKLANLYTDKVKSLMYALIVGLSPFMFNYAFELRAYTFFTLFSLLSWYGLLANRKYIFIFSIALGLYTHTFYVFNAFSLFLYIMFLEFKSLGWDKFLLRNLIGLVPEVVSKKKVRWFIYGALFYLPWMPVLFSQAVSGQDDFWITHTKLQDIYMAFYYLTGGVWGVPPVLKISILAGFVFVVLAVPVLLKSRFLPVFLFWGVLPVVLAVSISFFKPIFVPRYLIFTLPALLLPFLDLLDSDFKEKIVNKYSFLGGRYVNVFRYGFVGVLLVLFVVSNYYTFTNPTHTRYGYFAYTTLKEYPETNFVVTDSAIDYFGLKYYFAREGLTEGNVKYYNEGGNFPHFVGGVVVSDDDIITTLPQDRFLFVREGLRVEDRSSD